MTILSIDQSVCSGKRNDQLPIRIGDGCHSGGNLSGCQRRIAGQLFLQTNLPGPTYVYQAVGFPVYRTDNGPPQIDVCFARPSAKVLNFLSGCPTINNTGPDSVKRWARQKLRIPFKDHNRSDDIRPVPGSLWRKCMNATKVKDVLTTGEVAKICNVAPRTVSKWFDSGALHGYRIPGSKDRRIPLNQLIRFMKHHGMPLNGLMTGCTRVLIVDGEQDIVEVLEKILEDEAKYEVEVARGGFAAGLTAEKFRPHVILMDMHLPDIDGREVARQVKNNPDLQLTKVIAMSGKMTEEEAKGLMAGEFDGFLRKPFHVRQVIESIEDAMAVVY
jgi:excisionase family DNA binding protein